MRTPPDGGQLSHPRRDLDPLLTHAVRFSIVAALHGIQRAEFAAVRDGVEISDAMLSKQVALLEEAGYVEVEKGRVGRRPRTWLSLSGDGAAAFNKHVTALRTIAGLTDTEPSSPGSRPAAGTRMPGQ